jgi:hypothetical protein
MLIFYKALQTAMLAVFLLSLVTYLFNSDEFLFVPMALTAGMWVVLVFNKPRG